jgi:hypothetical protein
MSEALVAAKSVNMRTGQAEATLNWRDDSKKCVFKTHFSCEVRRKLTTAASQKKKQSEWDE